MDFFRQIAIFVLISQSNQEMFQKMETNKVNPKLQKKLSKQMEFCTLNKVLQFFSIKFEFLILSEVITRMVFVSVFYMEIRRTGWC